MKNLKEYLTEGNFFKNLGVGEKSLIEKFLKDWDINNYTINSDLTIDVNGKVDLRKYNEIDSYSIGKSFPK